MRSVIKKIVMFMSGIFSMVGCDYHAPKVYGPRSVDDVEPVKNVIPENMIEKEGAAPIQNAKGGAGEQLDLDDRKSDVSDEKSTAD